MATFKVKSTVGMLTDIWGEFASFAEADKAGDAWVEEQRSITDAEVDAGNIVAAEIPFYFSVVTEMRKRGVKTALEGQIDVNGRTRYFNRIRALKRVSKTMWSIESTIGVFTVEGGRAAGGTNRDWFLEGPQFSKAIYCTSLMDALRCIDTM